MQSMKNYAKLAILVTAVGDLNIDLTIFHQEI